MKIPQKLPSGFKVQDLRPFLNNLLDLCKSNILRGDEKTTVSTINSGGGGAGGGGDTYNGYFKATVSGNNITVAAGLGKVGNSIIEIAETTVTATSAGFIVVYFVWNGSAYTGTIQFIANWSALANGMDYDMLHTVEFSGGAVTDVKRNKTGWAFPTGKAV